MLNVSWNLLSNTYTYNTTINNTKKTPKYVAEHITKTRTLMLLLFDKYHKEMQNKVELNIDTYGSLELNLIIWVCFRAFLAPSIT